LANKTFRRSHCLLGNTVPRRHLEWPSLTLASCHHWGQRTRVCLRQPGMSAVCQYPVSIIVKIACSVTSTTLRPAGSRPVGMHPLLIRAGQPKVLTWLTGFLSVRNVVLPGAVFGVAFEVWASTKKCRKSGRTSWRCNIPVLGYTESHLRIQHAARRSFCVSNSGSPPVYPGN
jgi:hypothetical protein